jgi:23S rRNA (guanine2445-N2)-methyltransferase
MDISFNYLCSMNEDKLFRMTAKTLFGLEDVLAGELENIGAQNIEKLNRAVAFRGTKETMYRANLELRTALRIYKPIHSYFARNEEELYHGAYQVDWSKYLDPTSTFAIDSTVNSPNFNHANFVALKVKDAIADNLRKKFGVRPDVNVVNPDVRLHVHISEKECTISLDSSGNSLHKRGYRVGQTMAPLNEVLAAGMILLSGWEAKTDFVDPMCGSGTLLMEAATYAYNIPPGINIQQFGFMTWNDFDEELWESIRKRAMSCQREFEYKILGYDESRKAITITKANIKNAELGWKILLQAKKLEELEGEDIPEGGTLIMNPPYGERLDDKEIKELYKLIGDTFKQKFQGYTAWVISSNKSALKSIGLRTSKKLTLFNGSLECKYHRYDMYAGTKKAKWLEKNDEESGK